MIIRGILLLIAIIVGVLVPLDIGRQIEKMAGMNRLLVDVDFIYSIVCWFVGMVCIWVMVIVPLIIYMGIYQLYTSWIAKYTNQVVKWLKEGD